ncbi:MAG: hypothetical protein KKE24_01845 [Candidatus Thermoplasmatota archaeon]|nr:hypothetical protein [Candidatus Thermoplasmatota archaeon]
MLHRKDYLDDLAKTKLVKAAFELGLEVGEHGHIENVGWVNAELRHMMQEAQDLEIQDVVKRRYAFGKEKGRVRREGKISQIGGTKTFTKDQKGAAIQGAKKPQEPRPRFVERISSEEGIWSTVSVMKFLRGDEEMQSHLSNLFAGLVDLHDRLMQMPADKEPSKTFDNGLQVINDVGWITTYDVKFFDEKTAMAKVETTSLLSRSMGHCESPMCTPLCGIMETVGLKSFGRSVLAVEESCMAQDKPACTFKLFPRDLSRDEGI